MKNSYFNTKQLPVTFKQIWVNLYTHKARSILTMVGVVIGTASVFTIFSLSVSGSHEMQSRLMDYLPGSVLISDDYSSDNNDTDQNTITNEQAEQLLNIFKSNSFGSIACRSYTQDISFEDFAFEKRDNDGLSDFDLSSKVFLIVGVNPDYFLLKRLQLHSGRFINPCDSFMPVAVVPVNSMGKMEGYPYPPLGKKLYIDGNIFTIIGSYLDKKLSEEVIIPYNLIKYEKISETILFRGEQMQKNLLNDLKNISDLLFSRQINIITIEEIQKEFIKNFQQMSNLFMLIAAISLVIGCIGVANTLLASVNEKTFEIGVRSALGASPFSIFVLFISEAFFLCTLAGCFGVAIGTVISHIVCKIMGIPVIWTLQPVILSLGASMFIGFFGGGIPALRASSLNVWQAIKAGNA